VDRIRLIGFLHATNRGVTLKILFTGHQGSIGGIPTPILRANGHETVELDTGLFFGCDFENPTNGVPTLRLDLREVEPDYLRGSTR
jgi:hypothetical protein